MKRGILRVVLVACGVAVCQGALAGTGSVERGRYLATAGDCKVCHTAPAAGSQPFAGGYPLHAYFGTVYSSNITPDPKTGIGKWTPDDFYRALHEGIRADGKHLYPAFPYPYFTKLSRTDSDDLFAYLKTLRPVANVPPANKLIFPTNIRAMMWFWDTLFLHQSPFTPDPSKPAAWNRGGELVHGLGHCGGCHTPKNLLFSNESGKFLQGATLDGWYAPNLTGSMRTGLGKWSVGDITQYLKTGSNRFGRVTGSMQDVIEVSTSRLTDADRNAIAVYLKSLPAAPEETPKKPNPDVMAAGQTVFVQRCAVCHKADTSAYPKLGNNAIVQASDPATIVRVILQGAQSVATPTGPVGFSMPGFPVLSNADLADVATYIRNSRGNRASPVSSDTVSSIREQLRQKQ